MRKNLFYSCGCALAGLTLLVTSCGRRGILPAPPRSGFDTLFRSVPPTPTPGPGLIERGRQLISGPTATPTTPYRGGHTGPWRWFGKGPTVTPTPSSTPTPSIYQRARGAIEGLISGPSPTSTLTLTPTQEYRGGHTGPWRWFGKGPTVTPTPSSTPTSTPTPSATQTPPVAATPSPRGGLGDYIKKLYQDGKTVVPGSIRKGIEAVKTAVHPTPYSGTIGPTEAPVPTNTPRPIAPTETPIPRSMRHLIDGIGELYSEVVDSLYGLGSGFIAWCKSDGRYWCADTEVRAQLQRGGNVETFGYEKKLPYFLPA